jgi:Tfp pilus assembly protein PilO
MLFLQQAPLPPVPPELPQVIVANGPPEWVPFVAMVALVLGTLLLWPLIRALARRLEGKGGDTNALRAEISELHERVADVEQLQQRVFELENRLEFSERLLTQQREALLQRPEGRA